MLVWLPCTPVRPTYHSFYGMSAANMYVVGKELMDGSRGSGMQWQYFE